MGRPKGSRNKSTELVENDVISQVSEQKESEAIYEEKREERTEKTLLVKPVLDPLGPGQKYFEAPSGEILIGEADANHMWWRAGNGGKGMWINPKR
jgi:hypothetical protein